MPEYYKSFTADSDYDLNKTIEFYKAKIKEDYGDDVVIIIDISRDLASEVKEVYKNTVATKYQYEYYVCISIITEEEL